MSRHSRWSNPCAHGEHKGYKPGEYDPSTGITNPEKKGYVRGWNRADAVSGPGGLLATLTEFTGRSIRAVWIGKAYVVFSYDQPIAAWITQDDPGDGTEPTPIVWIDVSQYSQKTSEHQGAAHAWIGHAVDKWIAPSLVK